MKGSGVTTCCSLVAMDTGRPVWAAVVRLQLRRCDPQLRSCFAIQCNAGGGWTR